MANKIKCPMCGNEKFFEEKIIDNQWAANQGFGRVFHATSHICSECGFVAWFANDSVFKKVKNEAEAREERIKKNQAMIDELEEEKVKLNAIVRESKENKLRAALEIKELEEKAENESITLKEHRELLAQIEAKKKEIVDTPEIREVKIRLAKIHVQLEELYE